MVKVPPVKRTYAMSDGKMLQISRGTANAAEEDIADLTAYDPNIDMPFITHMRGRITLSDSFVKDTTVLAQQTGKTATVEQTMTNCRDHFTNSKRFIELAFPNNIPVWNEFGYNLYSAARDSQVLMIEFMQTFYTASEKYKDLLIARKYTQEKIDLSKTLHDSLLTADDAQESSKNSRPITTQERIELLNTVWADRETIASAGREVFKNNPAKRARYVAYSGGSGGEDAPTETPPAPAQ